MQHDFASRVETVQDQLAAENYDAYVAAHPENVYYLTGEEDLTGVYVVTTEETYFLVSRFSRHMVDHQAFYTEENKEEVLREHVPENAVSDHPGRLNGFAPTVEAVDWLTEMRAVKTSREIRAMEKAADVTVNGMEKAADMLRTELTEGITAFDVAAAVEHFFKKQGCTNAFHTAGPGDNLVQVNAVNPHKGLTAEPIQPEDLVIVDVGARNGMYCMDMSRTFCQDPSDRIKSMHTAVEKAQEAAVNMLADGVDGAAVDAEARDVLEQEGWDADQYFVHGLGHGVGINVHEKPRLSPFSDDTLKEGNVVTVEPGLYVPGAGGVRIEDTLLVEENGVRPLTAAEKAL